jgi:hypothetical protein
MLTAAIEWNGIATFCASVATVLAFVIGSVLVWNYGRRVRVGVAAEPILIDGSTFIAARCTIESVGNRTLKFHEQHPPLVTATPIGGDGQDFSSIKPKEVQPFGGDVSVPRLENVTQSCLIPFPEMDLNVIGWRVSLSVEASPTLLQRLRNNKDAEGSARGWEWQDNVFIARPSQGDSET